MEKEIKIKQVARYNGHNVKSSGVVEIGFSAMYSELTNSIQALQMLNNDVQIAIKKVNEDPFKLGVFRIKNVVIDGDGESKLKFISTNDAVEMDNLNNVITTEEFQIMLKATVETEV